MTDATKLAPVDLHKMIGEKVSIAMRLHLAEQEKHLGIHRVCDGVFFVTNKDMIEALRRHFESFGTYMGVPIMAPKQSDAECEDKK